MGETGNLDFHDFCIFETRRSPYLWIWIYKITSTSLRTIQGISFWKYDFVNLNLFKSANLKTWEMVGSTQVNINLWWSQTPWAFTMVRKKTIVESTSYNLNKSLKAWMVLNDLGIWVNHGKPWENSILKSLKSWNLDASWNLSTSWKIEFWNPWDLE